MKKLGFLTLVVVLLLVVVCAFGVSATTVERGNVDVLAGYKAATVPSDAVAVSTAQEFAAMQADGVYYLNADITLTGSYGEFAGKLYGNGHTVTATGVTVFDKLNGAEIYDLTLAGEVSGAGNHVGGLATEAYATTVVGVINTATVTNAGGGWMIVGGVLGYAENTTVRYCVNYGTVTGGSATMNEARPGGIVGQIDNVDAWLVIENCVNYGDINGINQTGAILARSQNSASVTIKNCVNFGRVYVGSSDSGSIVGKITCAGTATVENCINTGSVEGGTQVGMVGYVNAQNLYMTNCHNGCFLGCTTDCEHGVLSSRGGNLGAFVGGSDSESIYSNSVMVISGCTNIADLNGGSHSAGILCNVTAGRLTVENCTNSGNVTTTSGAVAGIGALISDGKSLCLNATFRNCVNTGKVKTAGGVGGGIVGYCDAVEAVLENCFNGCLAGCTAFCDHGKVECTSHGAGILANRDTRSVANSKTVVKSCTNTGRIATSASSSGGVCGWLGSVTIDIYDCFNGCQNGCTSCDHGVVSITANSNPGGIVGCVEGTNTITLKDCTNTADLGYGRTGGILGGCWSTANLIFDNCTNNGNINSTSNCDAGGILAMVDNAAANVTFKNCVNNGNITTPHNDSRPGGIAGVVTVANLTVENCTNNGTLTLQGYGAGIVARVQVSGKVQLKGVINNGNVSSANQYCSGIMGWTKLTSNITCIDVHNKGNITCKGSVGGILGNWDNGAATLYFENCSNTGTLTGALNAHVGGIIAWADNAANVITIKNCINTSDLTSDKYNVAGIAGLLNGTVYIENCTNSGNMTQTTSTHEDSGAAGIVGLVKNGGEGMLTIIGCSNTGNMSTVDGNAAGILGRSFSANSTIIKNCTNSGSCTTTANSRYDKGEGKYKDNCAGGIAGIVTSVTITIENCHNGCFSGCTTNCTHGQITCNSRYAGGILAYNYTTTSIINIKNCSNSGKIHAKEHVGGISGRLDHKNLTIENCSNGCFNGCTPAEGEYCVHGMITNTANNDFGGILGNADVGERDSLTVKNCYNNGRIDGQNRGGGITGVIKAKTILLQGNVNEGDVRTKNNYSAGVFGRIDTVASEAGQTVTIIDCINRGNLSQPNNYGGGLVGYMELAGALTLVNCHNYGDVAVGWQGAGLLSGVNSGVLEISMTNCSNSGTITSGRTDKDINSGGLIGAYWGGASTKATFIDCHNYGNISNTNAFHLGRMGGLIGCTSSTTTIKNCSNSGNITLNVAKNPNNKNEAVCEVGGMIGMKDGGDLFVDNFVNTGAIHGDVDHDLWNSASGGFIGAIRGDCNATVKNSVNRGKITNYPGAAAGMLGFRHGAAGTMVSFIGCKNYGEIVAENRYATGGIGYAYKSFEFIDCENHGKIDATAGGVAGGLLGRKNANADSAKCSVSFVNCLNTGLITGKGQCGGIAAAVDSASFFDVINCKNTGEIKNTSNWNSGVGGLVGSWSGANSSGEARFIGCVNEGYVTDGTKGRVGGILGVVENNPEGASSDAYGAHGNITFRDCINKGNVNSNGNYAAGIVCRVDFIKGAKTLTIENCTNEGKITAKIYHIGGIIGLQQLNADSIVIIRNCVNKGDITTKSNDSQMGGIAGDLRGGTVTIENCSNSGKLIGKAQTGGIAGRVTSGTSFKIINCTNTGAIDYDRDEGNGEVGGIVGLYNGAGDALFEGCVNTGAIGRNIKLRNGGILGISDKANITFRNCINKGSVTTSHYCGGIVCRLEFAPGKKAVFENCTNEGNVTGGGTANAGIFGWCEDASDPYTIEFINCVNRGTIKATSGAVGGIAGAFNKAQGTTSIKNCYNYGLVTTTSGRAGGIMGFCHNVLTIENCYNGCDKGCTTACDHGKVTSASGDCTAGILGREGDYGVIIINCTNDGVISGSKSVGGIAAELHGGDVTHTLTGCVNNGTVTSTGDYAAGMYCASYKSIVITNCHNTGDITANYAAGGMIARPMDAPSITLKGCTNSGNIKSKGVGGAGGLIGSVYVTYDITNGSSRPLTIENCHNSGNVTLELAKMEKNEGVGGLIGILQSRVGTVTIKNCSNSGTITATITERNANLTLGLGGAIGLIPATVNDGTRTVTVSKIDVDGFTNSGTISADSAAAGGVLGWVKPTGTSTLTVKNAVNYGNINITFNLQKQQSQAGGIIGYADVAFEVSDSKNYGSIVTAGSEWDGSAGGIVGYILGTHNNSLTDCVNYGTITSNCCAGGIAAWVQDGKHGGTTTFTRCINHGNVTESNGGGGNYAGGMVGYVRDLAKFDSCQNHGDVTSVQNRAGGMIGQINQASGVYNLSIKNCTNTGDILGLNETGGMAGNNDGTVLTVENCTSTGNITGGIVVGGMVGRIGSGGSTQYSAIKYCYVSGTITHTGKGAGGSAGVGGLSGYGWGVNYYNYNVIEADIVLKWSNTSNATPENRPSAAATVSYDNNGAVQMMYNVFTGTLDAGDGWASILGQTRVNCTSPSDGALSLNSNVHHNYAMTDVEYPLAAIGNDSADSLVMVGKPIQLTNGSDAATIVAALGNSFKVVNGTVVPAAAENAFKATANQNGTHTHSYATTLSKDATGHWYACSCGAAKDFAPHTWANNCDTTCEDCGYTRTVDANAHVYAGACDTTCENCTATRTVTNPVHIYTNSCDTVCNVCSATRTVSANAHVYDNACDTTCNICGVTRTVAATAHVYTNNCDTTCNTCGATRTVNSHVYDGDCDTTCNVCGVIRTATGAHAGEYACSTTCKVCGEAVTPGAHTYGFGCDSSCDLCGAVRTEGLVHSGAYACAVECQYCKTAIEATGDHVYGTSCDLTCNNCGFVRELPANSHTYTNGCDNSCNNCGFVRADSELTHTYELLCDTSCSTCGKTIAAQQPHTGAYSCATVCQWCECEIVPGAHTPEQPCSETCKDCGEAVPMDVAHTFANPCDPDCDLCGKIRTELVHTFANACDKVCEYCDYARDDAELVHTFAHACDKVCEYCDYARDDAELVHTYPYPCADKCANCDAELVPGAHIPVSDCAGICKNCGAAVEVTGEHTYSDLCDLDCDACGVERPVSEAHQYHTDCDTTCNICGFVREVTDTHEFLYACLGCIKCGETTEETVAHTYAAECDETCDVCGYIRTFEEGLKLHTYDNLCDTDCNYGCGLVRPQRAHKGAYLCSTACQWCGAEIEGKDHVYSNSCDDTCGYCGEVTRVVDSHVGEFACSETCKLCGVAIVGAAHTFANACDTDCDVCGLTREVAPHAGEFACSTVCQHCGAAVTGTDHTFANDCDTDCDICGATREVGEHVYDNDCDAECNNCGELREVGEHVYDNACDTDCNTCGATREVDDHTYDNACDTDCNVCGETREPADHVYSNACDGECNVCGNLREPADHVYDNDSDAVCNVCEAVRQIESDDEDDDKDSEGSDSNDNSNASGSGNTTTTTDEDGSAIGVVITVVMIVLAVVIVVAVVFIGSGSKDQKRSKKFQPSKKNNKGKKSK